MIEASRKKTAKLAVCDVRQIQLGKFAQDELILPYESNLLFLNETGCNDSLVSSLDVRRAHF
jgi:hypothetical protein